MAKDLLSQNYGVATGRFWRNVVLIALAHVALIAGLIRWSVAARVSSNSESVVWLGGAGDLSSADSEKQESPSPAHVTPALEPIAKNDEVEQEKRVVSTTKSEIELPSATPKPTATATPRPKLSATPALRPEVAPKPIAKPTPKKTVMAKAAPKPSPKPKPSTAKADAKSEKKDKITLTKKDSASQNRSEKAGSTGKASTVGGEGTASEFGWYGNMLHDRFYSAWIQPTTNIPSGHKISTLAAVWIERDGRVSKFEIVRPSENPVVNESVAAVAKQVTAVDPPPTGLMKGDHYDIKINFELNTEIKTEN